MCKIGVPPFQHCVQAASCLKQMDTLVRSGFYIQCRPDLTINFKSGLRALARHVINIKVAKFLFKISANSSSNDWNLCLYDKELKILMGEGAFHLAPLWLRPCLEVHFVVCCWIRCLRLRRASQKILLGVTMTDNYDLDPPIIIGKYRKNIGLRRKFV